MKNRIKIFVSAVLFVFLSGKSMAAFSLNATRYIYESDKHNVSVTVSNNADKAFGGQVWIENSTQGNGVYMVPQPPFFKVGAGQKQVVRILKTNSNLPEDRESLFFLNVQEIPPKPEAKDGSNVLSIAMNTKVKLIYRPQSIKNGRQNAEKQLRLEQRDGKTWLKNPTPYYFAVVKVTHNGKEVNLSEKAKMDIARLAPFSDVPLGNKITGTIKISAVNDWGGVDSYDIH
ncbi:fimbrial chaperone [Escherichia coli]|nr:fimbrial chaperone [Escherichia coli]